MAFGTKTRTARDEAHERFAGMLTHPGDALSPVMTRQAEPAAIVVQPESCRSSAVPRVLVMTGPAFDASLNQQIVGDGSSHAACRRRWMQMRPLLHLKPVVVDAHRMVALVIHRSRARSIVTRHAGVARSGSERKTLRRRTSIPPRRPRRQCAGGSMTGRTIVTERRQNSDPQGGQKDRGCSSDCHCGNLRSDNEKSVPDFLAA